MTFLDRIHECNAHDLSKFTPFVIEDTPAGWIARDLVEALSDYADVFSVTDGGVELSRGLTDFDARTKAVDAAVRDLHRRARLRLVGHELYAVAPSFGAPPWLALERSALPAFGARAHGLHVHGVVRKGDVRHLWIGRRARDKSTFPGMLDNMVAGGQPIGLSLRENLLKECDEEGSIPAELASTARPTGTVSYKVETEDGGLRNDVLFLYELELPEDVVPVNRDGEVESFELWPIERVMETVANTREFKFNCNLAIVDYLVRHGDIPAEHSDYVEICRGLRQ